jgi:hypothetical protein
MQTINFQCGHCRKIMGVQAAYLGKQVRCPHCQQVVLAPTQAPAPVPAAAAPAPVPPPSSPPPPGRVGDEHDSIFGEQIDDDLFGSPPKSKVELPEPRPAPQLQLEPTMFNVPGVSSGAGPALTPPPSTPSPAYSEPPTTDLAPSATEGNGEGGTIPVRSKTLAPQNPILTNSLLIILIPYSILMTIIVLIQYFNQQRTPHPLEMLPDLGNPPAKKVGQAPPPVLNLSSYVRYKADAALPPHLITTLGQPIQVGDIEITPLSIEQKRLLFKWRTGQYKPELSEFEALVLNVKLKNLSKDTEFRPLDLSFDYIWKEEKSHPISRLPYTHLEFNGKRYCGPFQWKASVTKNQPGQFAGSDEYVEGQEEYNRVLLPGEEVKTAIVTDPADQVAGALRNYRGKLLWRVQVRRGLVHYKDRDISVAAVIGIQFDKDEIVRK